MESLALEPKREDFLAAVPVDTRTVVEEIILTDSPEICEAELENWTGLGEFAVPALKLAATVALNACLNEDVFYQRATLGGCTEDAFLNPHTGQYEYGARCMVIGTVIKELRERGCTRREIDNVLKLHEENTQLGEAIFYIIENYPTLEMYPGGVKALIKDLSVFEIRDEIPSSVARMACTMVCHAIIEDVYEKDFLSSQLEIGKRLLKELSACAAEVWFDWAIDEIIELSEGKIKVDAERIKERYKKLCGEIGEEPPSYVKRGILLFCLDCESLSLPLSEQAVGLKRLLPQNPSDNLRASQQLRTALAAEVTERMGGQEKEGSHREKVQNLAQGIFIVLNSQGHTELANFFKDNINEALSRLIGNKTSEDNELQTMYKTLRRLSIYIFEAKGVSQESLQGSVERYLQEIRESKLVEAWRQIVKPNPNSSFRSIVTQAAATSAAIYRVLPETELRAITEEGHSVPNLLLLGSGSETRTFSVTSFVSNIRSMVQAVIDSCEEQIQKERSERRGVLPIGGKVQAFEGMHQVSLNRYLDIFSLSKIRNTPFRLIHGGQSLVLPPVTTPFELMSLVRGLQFAGAIQKGEKALQITLPGRWSQGAAGIVGSAVLLSNKPGLAFAEGAFESTHEITDQRILVYDDGVKNEGLPYDNSKFLGRTDMLEVIFYEAMQRYQFLGTLATHGEYGGIFTGMWTRFKKDYEDLIANYDFEGEGLVEIIKSSAWVSQRGEKSDDDTPEMHEAMIRKITTACNVDVALRTAVRGLIDQYWKKFQTLARKLYPDDCDEYQKALNY